MPPISNKKTCKLNLAGIGTPKGDLLICRHLGNPLQGVGGNITSFDIASQVRGRHPEA